MIRIGEFSKLAKTTVKTLRFYDEIDLFKPSFVDDNGYRYYTVEQLAQLQSIVDLRAIDMPIDEIKLVLKGGDMVAIFDKRLAELECELNNNLRSIRLTKDYMARAKEGDFMKNYQAKEITLQACTVFYRHGVIDSMANFVPFILEAGAEVTANNPDLKCLEPDYCYVTYSAKEYKERDIELEYAQAVEKAGVESANIKFKQVPQHKAISVAHKGSYSELGKAYTFALNYIKEHGYTITAPIRECYINGCWDTENEADYLTEIQIPID